MVGGSKDELFRAEPRPRSNQRRTDEKEGTRAGGTFALAVCLSAKHALRTGNSRHTLRSMHLDKKKRTTLALVKQALRVCGSA